MSLLGTAAVAMWWTIKPERRSEFGDWHSHEHFPERMSIRGFNRGSRWTSETDADGFFVLYELEQYETLTSPGYLDRLNAPTPWSQKMMPHHLGMVRSQCRIEASFGGGVATSLATICLSPKTGGESGLKDALVVVLRALPEQPGLTGAHLLFTQTPRTAGQTTEQKIRGSDGVADWIVLVSGYEPQAVADIVAQDLSTTRLNAMGAQDNPTSGGYRLSYTMTPQDVAGAK